MPRSADSTSSTAPRHTSIAHVLDAARELGAVSLETPAGWLVSIPRPSPSHADMLSEDEAAALAGTSTRVLRDARRAGELRMLGKQRSRMIRRADLDAWLEQRRAPVERGADDDGMARRVERIERARKAGQR